MSQVKNVEKTQLPLQVLNDISLYSKWEVVVFFPQKKINITQHTHKYIQQNTSNSGFNLSLCGI